MSIRVRMVTLDGILVFKDSHARMAALLGGMNKQYVGKPEPLRL